MHTGIQQKLEKQIKKIKTARKTTLMFLKII